MPRGTTRRPASRRRRSPRPSWPQRNAAWLVAAAAVVVVAVALLLVANSGDEEASEDATGAVVGGDLHSLVADPTTPGRLFAGGHEAVSVSDDGGITWRRVPSLDDKDAMGWAFTDDAVYVSGHPGLNRSTDDGGLTFAMVNEGLPHTDVHAFGGGGGVLYGASPAVGLFASRDEGDTWEILTDEAGQSFFGRIVVDPDDPEHLLAADARVGVVESRDAGQSWQQVGSLPSATWITAPAAGLEVVIASGPAGAARSEDGGETWEPFALPSGALLAEISPDGETIYAAAHSGTTAKVSVSRDGGRTWTD